MSKKIIGIGGGIIVLIVLVVISAGFFLTSNKKNEFKSLFELSNISATNQDNLFSVFSGTYVSENNGLVTIKLHGNGGIFSGIKIVPETEIVQIIKGGNGSFRQEKRSLENIREGAKVDITTSAADPNSKFTALYLRYE